MSDFDTRRIGEIAVLEERIQQLQAQLAVYKADAEKWTPKASSKVDGDKQLGLVSLTFGGKTFAATMSYAYLKDMDLTTATTAVVETLCKTHVGDRLRSVIEPEVAKVIANAKAANEAGTW